MKTKLALSALVVALLGVVTLQWAYHADAAKYHHLYLGDSPVTEGQTWCVIGDGGMGNEAARAVAEAAVHLGCDQVRYVGDIVYRHGIRSHDDPLLEERFLDPLAPIIERGIPIYLVMGNHDWHSNPWAWMQVAEEIEGVQFPYFQYAESYGDVCVFNLETNWHRFQDWVNRLIPQGDWLYEAYDKVNERCRLSIAFGHHPLISSGKRQDKLWKLSYLREKVFGHLDLYLAGHEHYLADEGQYKGTTQLISGSASKTSPVRSPQRSEGPAAPRFAVSRHGLVTLRFSEDESGRPMVRYDFYTVDPDAPGQAPANEWGDTVVGQGIRGFTERY